MKKLHKGLRSRLALLLAVLLAISLLPISALADTWKTHPEEATDYRFYYNGSHSSTSLKFTTLEAPAGVPISKYTLVDNQGKYPDIVTYCSDFEVAPVQSDGTVSSLLYKRIPMENVDTSQNLFTGTAAQVAAKTAKLRTILIHSDLLQNIGSMRASSGISSLTEDEAMAATQIAIWKLVNGVTPVASTGMYSKPNVRAYVAYLESLPGTGPDAMANINIKQVTKETSGSGMYQAVIEYQIEGIGVNLNNLAPVEIETLTYTTVGGQTIAVNAADISHVPASGQITVHNIPLGAKLNFTLSSDQDNVQSVYIFEPAGGKNASQTLVGIVTDTVPLKTSGDVTSPGDLGKVRIVKDWTKDTETGSILPNVVARDHTATFRFTYADGGFANVQVIGDVTITGNGYFESGAVFEVGRLYKVEEIAADGIAPAGSKVKYFTMEKVGASVNVVWTDASGNPLAGETNRFTNAVRLTTGSLKVEKKVNVALGVERPNEVFTFSIMRNYVLYYNEAYRIYEVGDLVNYTTGITSDAGTFTLGHGQYAVFESIPSGDMMTVQEIAQTGQSDRYVMDTVAKTVAIAADQQESVNVVNVVKTGSLTVEKVFGAGSALGWSQFTQANPLVIKVTDGSGFEKSIKLYDGHSSETIVLPTGIYTVTEENGQVSGYALVTGYSDQNPTVLQDGLTMVTVSNSYRKLEGGLEVGKTVVQNDGLTIADGKVFTFVLKKGSSAVSGASYTVGGVTGTTNASGEFTLKDGEVAVFASLVPGSYTVTEKDAQISGYKLVTTSSGSTVTVKDEASASVSFTNTYSELRGELEVAKTLSGDAAAVMSGQVFTFTLYGPDGQPVKNWTPSGGFAGTDANGKFTITGAGKVTFKDLLVGDYYVVEDTASATGITWTVSYNNQATGSAAKVSVNSSAKSSIAVENTYDYIMAELAFTKTVTGLDGQDASFTVSHNGASGTVSYKKNGGTVTKIASGSTISGIKNGDNVVIMAPVGTVITVKEAVNPYYSQSASSADAAWVVDGGALSGTATVATGTTPVLAFQNARITTGGIEFEKVLTGADWSKFPNGITFEITGPAGWATAAGFVAPTGVSFGAKSGSSTTYTFKISSSAMVEFKTLPAGKYTITELTSTANLTGFDRETYVWSNDGVTKVKAEKKEITLVTNAVGTAKFENEYAQRLHGIGFEKTAESLVAGETFSFKASFYSTDPSGGGATPVAMPAGASVTGAQNVLWDGARTVVTFDLVVPADQKLPKVNITGIPEGTWYKIEETAAPGYVLAQASIGKVSSSGTATVKMTNSRLTDGALTVSKTVTGVYDGEAFTFTLKVNNVNYSGSYTVGGVTKNTTNGQFKLKDGETAVFSSIPRGAALSIRENSSTNYSTSHVINGGAPVASATATATMGTGNGAAVSVDFSNARKTTSTDLTVKKVLAGTAKDDSTVTGMSFTFVLKRGSTVIANQAYTISGAGTGSGVTGADGSFQLKGGEIATFAGLASGSYTVTEQDVTPPANITWSKSITNNGLAFVATNTFRYKTGELDVTKKLAGTAAAELSGQSFEFTLKDAAGNAVDGAKYTIGSSATVLTAMNGVFTLKGGETAHFSGLKNGDYLVVETAVGATAQYAAAITSYSPAGAVTVADSQTNAPKITVTNEIDRLVGELTVTKTASGADVVGKDFVFTLYRTMTGGSVAVVNQSYTVGSGSFATDAAGQFSLKAGETAQFGNLPAGENYYVVEDQALAAISGYSLVISGEGATNAVAVISGGVGEIRVDNAYTRQMGDLTVSKTVTGLPAGSTWSYGFELTGPADYNGGNPLSFSLSETDASKTFAGLPGGDYILTEMTGDRAGYALTTTINGSQGSSATISVGGAAASGNVVNAYRELGTQLILAKTLDGASYTEVGTTQFAFTLEEKSAGSWVARSSIALDATKTVDTIFLTPGEYRIREELASAIIERFTFLGVSYQVETSAGGSYAPDADGWIEFEISDQMQIKITATNGYVKDGAMVKVTKEVDGYAGDDNFVFQITGDAMQYPLRYTIEGESSSITTDDNGFFSLKAGQTAVFTGLDTKRDYTVTEVDMKSVYTFQRVTAENFTFTIDGQGVPQMNNDAAAIGMGSNGQSFTVKMGEKANDAFPGAQITFLNERLLGNLTITKRAVGPLYDGNAFTMYVNFEENGGAVSAAQFDQMLVHGGAPVIENGAVKVSVAVDQAVVITGIPAGVTYTVAEDPGAYYYKISTQGETGTIGQPILEPVSGEVTPHVSNCIVTNERKTGSVSITKYVRGEAGSYNGEKFEVVVAFIPGGNPWTAQEIADLVITGGTGTTVTASGNGATVTALLGDGENFKISNIPAGTAYTVKEILTGSQKDRYSYVLAGYDGMVDPSLTEGGTKLTPENDEISLFNFDVPYNSIVVGKQVQGTAGSSVFGKSFDFKLTLFKPGASTGYGQQELQAQMTEVEQQMKDLVDPIAAQKLLVEEAELRLDPAAYDAALAILRETVNEDGSLTQQAEDAIGTPMMDCPACAGTGQLSETDDCTDCDNGKVDGEEDCHSCAGTRLVDCDSCEDGWIGEEQCTDCPGTGKLDCTDCEDGKVSVQLDCSVCGGDGLVETGNMLPCGDCDENYQVVDTDALMTAQDTAKADALAAFNAEAAVQTQRALEVQQAELDRLEELLNKLQEIYEKLLSGRYVEWDAADGTITLEAELDTIALQVKADDVSVYEETAGGKQSLSLSDVGLGVDADGMIVTDADGSILFSLKHNQFVCIDNLPEGAQYNVTELQPGSGAEAYIGSTISVNGSEHTGRSADGQIEGVYVDPITGDPVVNDPTGKGSGNVIIVANMYEPALGQLTVSKTWANAGQTSAITVELVMDGVRTGKTMVLDSSTNWRGSFTGLELGRSYTVVELDPPAGYSVSYSLTGNGVTLVYANKDSAEITVTNTGTNPGPNPDPDPEYGKLAVHKAWVNAGETSAVTVELVIDGVRTGKTLTLDDSNNWSGVFDELALGKHYSVLEINPPEGYRVSYSVGEGGILLNSGNKNSAEITVTNFRTEPDPDPDPTKGKLTVYKAWVNAVQKSAVTVELVIDGERTGKTIILDESTNWSGTFGGLELGKHYSVIEINPPTGYSVSYSISNAGLLLDDSNRQSAQITVTNSRTNGGRDRDRDNSRDPGDPEEPVIEIPEDPVPLDPFTPEDPTTEVPDVPVEIELENPPVPLGPGGPLPVPQTGDEGSPVIYLGAMIAALLGGLGLLFGNKKRREDEN